MSYNGWKNYETWNVALWIDNDQGSYQQRLEMTQQAWDNTNESDSKEDRLESAKSDLSTMLKEWIEEQNPLTDASMFSDLLSAALSEVDYYEIAENFLTEIDTDIEEEDEEDEEEEDEAK